MNTRRVATGIAGAAGLIALTTLLARAAGFARILVFADAVRARGVGEVYQSVNALPNVLFEVAAGGVLAAVAVPLIAHRLGAGERERADRLASVLLSWALVVLVPLAGLLWLAAPALAGWLITDFDPRAHEVATTLLRIFAVQVPLYGVGIILTGLLQAHRRFLAAAVAPLVSSVVVLGSYLWYGSLTGGETAPSRVSDTAIGVLGWGTTLGVVVLSLPLVVPALATGWRWRPGLRLERDDAVRIGALAGAGVLALAAQQGAVLVTIWLANHSGDRGTFPVYQYAQAVYLLPYAVLAVPVATSAFPALAERSGAGEDATATVARSLRAVLVLTGLAAGVLLATAPAVGAFFAVVDARRGADGASPAALAALPGALTAYAPGVVGFGVTALLTRALYVRGRPLDAAMAVALGWAVAALLPLVVVGAGQGPDATLRWLGLSSTLGMTVSAAGLALLVRGTWGREATAGAGRTAGVLVLAAAAALLVGDLVTRGRSMDTLLAAVLWGGAAGAVGLLVGVVVLGVGDRAMMGEVLRRGRTRRRGGSST
ncbi:murein biosynthesis integral membrane protein MurJ [Oryzobacter sp. R7]|uniref:murein biosynthesis integral membrane protein MurJ n=1 Tax=Oryzobacter faecalis TaxID=3388656 RepID=UPI00398D0B57